MAMLASTSNSIQITWTPVFIFASSPASLRLMSFSRVTLALGDSFIRPINSFIARLVQTGAFALLTLLTITSDEIGCRLFVSPGFARFSVDAGGEGNPCFGTRPDWPVSACAENSKTQKRANSRCTPSRDRRVLESGTELICISPKAWILSSYLIRKNQI